ncbi:hypothetical protein D3C77_378760 [compost metagenome]
MRDSSKLDIVESFIHPYRQKEWVCLLRFLNLDPRIFRIKLTFGAVIDIKRESHLLTADVFQVIAVPVAKIIRMLPRVRQFNRKRSIQDHSGAPCCRFRFLVMCPIIRYVRINDDRCMYGNWIDAIDGIVLLPGAVDLVIIYRSGARLLRSVRLCHGDAMPWTVQDIVARHGSRWDW